MSPTKVEMDAIRDDHVITSLKTTKYKRIKVADIVKRISFDGRDFNTYEEGLKIHARACWLLMEGKLTFDEELAPLCIENLSKIEEDAMMLTYP